MLKVAEQHGYEFRLVNGTTNSSGRVEVLYSGMWGTICDDSWDNDDSAALCRHMGFKTGTAHMKATFGRGTGPIWLDNIECASDENTTITDCLLGIWGKHDCDHGEDAGAICSNNGKEYCLSLSPVGFCFYNIPCLINTHKLMIIIIKITCIPYISPYLPTRLN